MLATLFKEADEKQPSPVQAQETAIWRALGMDKLTEEMTKDSQSGTDVIFNGTGYTANACYMCNNSATSAYCNPPMC